MVITPFYQKVTDTFGILSEIEASDKYVYIMDLGKKFKVEENIKDDEHLIKECASAAYIKINITNNIITLIVDSDSLLVKGLLFLLKKCFDGELTSNLHNFNPAEFIAHTHLSMHVTNQRMLGLVGALRQIQKEIYKYQIIKGTIS